MCLWKKSCLGSNFTTRPRMTSLQPTPFQLCLNIVAAMQQQVTLGSTVRHSLPLLVKQELRTLTTGKAFFPTLHNHLVPRLRLCPKESIVRRARDLLPDVYFFSIRSKLPIPDSVFFIICPDLAYSEPLCLQAYIQHFVLPCA